MKLCFIFCLVFSSSIFLNAEDSVIEDENSINLEELTKSDVIGIKLGSSAQGVMALGWTSEPKISDLAANFDFGFYYAMNTYASIDARPDSNFRIFGQFSTKIPDGNSISWASVSIDELYTSIIILDNLNIRVGKQTISMGQGINIISGQTDGLSMKASFPFLGLNFTALALLKNEYLTGGPANWQNVGIAGSYEGSIGDFSLGLAGFFQKDSTPLLDIYFQTVIASIDTKIATTLQFLPENKVAPLIKFYAFWEGLSPKLRMDFSYVYDAKASSGNDHSIGLRLALSGFSGSTIKVGGEWNHSFMENAGKVQIGVIIPIINHIDLTIGLPFYYGSLSSRYALQNIDPGKRILGLLISINLNGEFTSK